jgi:replicative superfamily II helicase
MFYYSPFDVADLRRNFVALFKANKENDDLYVSMALANVDSMRMGIVSKAEREEFGPFMNRVQKEFGRDEYMETAIKGGFCYNAAMTGGNPGNVASVARMLQWDFPRLGQVLSALDTLGCKWNKANYFKELQARVAYGVSSHLIPFVKLPDIGKVRAERLWSVGFRSVKDMIADPEKVRIALNMKADKILDILNAAKGQALTTSDFIDSL